MSSDVLMLAVCTVLLATLYLFSLAVLLARIKDVTYRIDLATRDLLESIEAAKEDVLEVRRW